MAGAVNVATNERLVCSIAPVEAILRLSREYPVFPCRRHPAEVLIRGERKLAKAKSPLTVHGFQDATQDPDQIRAWWRDYPEALVGVPTGGAARLVVVDYDEYKAETAAKDWIIAHSDALLSTRSHTTLGGGRHYLFRAVDGLEYRGGVSLMLDGVVRPGIDVRAEGGYIIWWPLHGGSAMGEIALLPAGLIDERKIETRELEPLPKATPDSWRRDKAVLTDILPWLDPADYDRWREAGMAISLASGGSDDGFALWHAWSSGELTGDCPANYAGIQDCRYRWASYRHDKDRGATVTIGTLVHRAKQAGYKPKPRPPEIGDAPHDELPPVEAYLEEGAVRSGRKPAAGAPAAVQEPPGAPPHAPIDWRALEGKEPPPREWVMPEWIPAAHVTLLAGKGGVGKTLLAQHIGTALAGGKHYITDLAPKRVLMWAGEDDERELWWRQRNICSYLGLTFSDIADRFCLHSYAGTDITLAIPIFGTLERTAMLGELARQVKEFAADIVILDNIARIYGGNENERHSVTTFVAWVQGACAPAAVLLLGHPSKMPGSEFSGSTAWEGSVRSRLYLGDTPPDAVPGPDDDAPAPDGQIRYFARRKANYSDTDLIKLRLLDGALVPVEEERRIGSFNPDSEMSRQAVRYALESLSSRDVHSSASTSSPAYLPKLAKQYGLLGTLTDKQFATAMRAMIMDRTIARAQVGMYENRTPKFGLVVQK